MDVLQQILTWCDEHGADYLFVGILAAAGTYFACRQLSSRPLGKELDKAFALNQRLAEVVGSLGESVDALKDAVHVMNSGQSGMSERIAGMLDAFRAVVSVAEGAEHDKPVGERPKPEERS